MDEQLAQVSVEDFIADMLLNSGELGPPLQAMPDCGDFLQRNYPGLTASLATERRDGVEVLLVISSCPVLLRE